MLELDKEQSFYKTFANDAIYAKIKEFKREAMAGQARTSADRQVSPRATH